MREGGREVVQSCVWAGGTACSVLPTGPAYLAASWVMHLGSQSWSGWCSGITYTQALLHCSMSWGMMLTNAERPLCQAQGCAG